MIAGAAMGVGAMTAGALKLPLTAVLLPSLLFASDALAVDAGGDRGCRRFLRHRHLDQPEPDADAVSETG